MKNHLSTKSGKLILGFISVCMLLLSIGGAALAAEPVKVVNGNEISFPDAQPFIDGNRRTQAPARFIARIYLANQLLNTYVL